MPLTANLSTLFKLSGQHHIKERWELRKMFTGPRVGCTVYSERKTLFTLVIAFIDGVCSTGSFQTQLWRITLASIHTSAAHTNQLSPSSTQKPTYLKKRPAANHPTNQASNPDIHATSASSHTGSSPSKVKEGKGKGKGDQAHLEGRESADGNRGAQACLRAILVFSCH